MEIHILFKSNVVLLEKSGFEVDFLHTIFLAYTKLNIVHNTPGIDGTVIRIISTNHMVKYLRFTYLKRTL